MSSESAQKMVLTVWQEIVAALKEDNEEVLEIVSASIAEED